MEISFEAYEYQADGTLTPAQYAYDGSQASGWTVKRDGKPVLNLGPGYRLLRSARCGVCSTDLARRFLPFPLPQITGHEVVARDEHGNDQGHERPLPPKDRPRQ